MGFSKASTQRWLACAAAVTTAFALLPATGGEARKKTCKVRGSHTHYQTKSLRVFTIFRGSNTGAGSSTYFACYRKNGRKTRIGFENGRDQTATYKPVGRLVPYLNFPVQITRAPRGRWTARLLDAKSGKLKFDFSILDKDGDAIGLLATPSGGLAFTLTEDIPAGEDTPGGSNVFVVGHKAGTGKHAYTKLFSRPHEMRDLLNIRSLTRKGDVVSWRVRDERTVPISFFTGSADLGR